MGRGIGIFGRDPCYGIYATPACRATWYLKGNEGSKKKIKKGKWKFDMHKMSRCFCISILEYIVVLRQTFFHLIAGGIADTENKAKSRGIFDFLKKAKDKLETLFSSEESLSSSMEENRM